MTSRQELFPFRTESNPRVYAYILPSASDHDGYIKVGYTERNVEERIREQLHTAGMQHVTLINESAMRKDGSTFTDKDVHRFLKNRGFRQLNAGEDRNEWFKCSEEDVRNAIISIKDGKNYSPERTQNFRMREEQKQAVSLTYKYFSNQNNVSPNGTYKFLWNAKMRFGKTFTTYQLAKKMDFKRILILTFKPVVQSQWKEDLETHVDFEDWQFIARPQDSRGDSIDEQYKKSKKKNPIVCFGSFQDFLGKDQNTGGIKAHNEWVHQMAWDLVVFDEYHYGAWTTTAQSLFDEKEIFEADLEKYDKERGNALDESWLPISAKYYLYLSGTPFRALNSGEFLEDQIFNWTYSQEQQAKIDHENDINNPYASLPRMVMMTYKIPDEITDIAKQGEFDEFDLNTFFKTEGTKQNAQFINKSEVQKWLDLIRGAYAETTIDDLRLGAKKPPFPFKDAALLSSLNHTLWFLPGVNECYAMANILNERQNNWYHNSYTINVCAGTEAGVGLSALEPVQNSMEGALGENPLETRTITLSCGKLMTGVTVKPWTGIFMLCNLSKPESYFQAAFRVQSPWTMKNDKNETIIIKEECYVFDFALNRALKQISDYATQLRADSSVEQRVSDFIKFLPVLAYDGASMRQINATEILDFVYSGTSASMLAKRWESALLVNVNNETLLRLQANEKAMEALMKIEGFRSLNKDIETIISKSEAVRNARSSERELTQKERKELSKEERESKSLRKQIQEKLIKFATRIPVFMYLTDYREESLKDVITQLEPRLFKKVTGLEVEDFELLVSLNVFNENLMNESVYNFRRYEESSLSYAGLNKHEGESIGLFNTVLSRSDYDEMAKESVMSMNDDRDRSDDIPEEY